MSSGMDRRVPPREASATLPRARLCVSIPARAMTQSSSYLVPNLIIVARVALAFVAVFPCSHDPGHETLAPPRSIGLSMA